MLSSQHDQMRDIQVPQSGKPVPKDTGHTTTTCFLQLAHGMQPHRDANCTSDYAAAECQLQIMQQQNVGKSITGVGLTWPACWVPGGQVQAGMQPTGERPLAESACYAA